MVEEEIRAQSSAERAAVWETVKRENPQMAEFLERFKKKFGRPVAVTLILNDRVIYRHGRRQ